MAARKRKTPQPTAEAVADTSTPDAAPATGTDVFDQVIAARQTATAQYQSPAAPTGGETEAQTDQPKAFQPDPFPQMSISLGDDNDAPRVRLYRNRRMNQVAIRFDEKPAEPVRKRLRDEGYKWRDAEGVWTKQLGEQRATGQLAAERLVEDIANAVRAESGIAAVGRTPGE